MFENELFNDTHIKTSEIVKEKDSGLLSYYISDNPELSLYQELVLNYHIELSELEFLGEFKNINKILFIDNLFVKESCRLKGTGTKLIKTIQSIAFEENVDAILLVSQETNLKYNNLGFYKKNGFFVVDGLEEYNNLLIKNVKKNIDLQSLKC